MTYSAENPQDSPAPRRSATSRALPLAPLALLSCTGIYSFWCFCAASATQRNAASAPQRLLSYCYSYRVWTVTAAVQCERCVFCLFIHNNIIRAQGYRVPAVPGYRRERPARPAGKRYRLPGTAVRYQRSIAPCGTSSYNYTVCTWYRIYRYRYQCRSRYSYTTAGTSTMTWYRIYYIVVPVPVIFSGKKRSLCSSRGSQPRASPA